MNRPQYDEDTVDLRLLLASLWARRWWIAGSVVLLTLAAVVIAFNLSPMYRASTVMVPTGGERSSLSGSLGAALAQVGGLASLAGMSVGGGGSTTEEALAVLRSRQFTERFIVDLNLMPKLFQKQWDAEAGKWKVPPEKQPTLAKAFKYFASEVRTVSQDPKTRLVTLRIEWRDPQEAALWANELVQRLNSEMRSRAISKSKASIEFLEQELSATRSIGTREAINRLIESEMRERMLANVTHEYAFRVVDVAMPPDIDDPVRSTKLLLLLLGPFLGLIIGVVVVRVLDSVVQKNTRAPA